MDAPYIHLFDTTLRDGAQTAGIDFSADDKRRIARLLDGLGLDYIEGGWPGANPTDDDFFGKPPPLQRAKLVAFGMTRRPGVSAANDPGLAAILNASVDVFCFVGKASAYQAEVALGVSLDENLSMIGDTATVASARLSEVLYDAEHFFDGYKANPDYALACLKAAQDGGARWLVLCDTNGGTLPDEVSRIIGEVRQQVPSEQLAVHFHNDTENAVANSLAAIAAGARQVQGTLNGIGERCGNANLSVLIPTLRLKTDYDIAVDETTLQQMTPVSRQLDLLLNRKPAERMAYVGTRAFAHKGGLHASAVARDPRTYEHVPPEAVGNKRDVVISDQAGKSNLLTQFAEFGLNIAADDPRLAKLLTRIKALEVDSGLSFDGADASFELFCRRFLDAVPRYFELDRFRVIDERRWNVRQERVVEAVAMVQIELQGEERMEAAKGSGPVDALNQALRKVLLDAYPLLDKVQLSDYRVRIIDSHRGTAAITRVHIESQADETTWTTIGVSHNILDASYQALEDALVWYLFRQGAVPLSLPLARKAQGKP